MVDTPIFKPGDTCGPFTLHRLLERGVPEIYLATHTKTRSPVFLQCADVRRTGPATPTDAQWRDTLLKLASLKSKFISTPVDADVHKDTIRWVASKHVSGRPLGPSRSGGPWPPLSEIFAFALLVAKLMKLATSAGVLHGNLNPQSVLVEDRAEDVDASLCIIGLGSAELFGVPAAVAQATPLYRAPEQLLGEPIDARADIYSLGMILYELIAQRPPFWGKDGSPPSNLLNLAKVETPEPLSDVCGCAAVISNAIEATTQKQPGERFPDWTHAAAAIDYVFHHVQSDPAQRTKDEKQKVDRERSQDADAHFVRMNSGSDGVISGFRPRCLADIALLNEDSDLIGTSTEQGATTDTGSADQLAELAPPTPDTGAATAPASPPPSTQRSNEPTAEIQPSPPEHASRSLQQVPHRWGLRRGPRLNAVLMLALTFVAGAGTALIASALASEERAQLALFQAVPREILLLMVTAPEAPSRPLDSTPVAAPATPDAHQAVSRPAPLRATGNPRPNILDSSPKGPRSSVIKDWETRHDTEASSARPQ